jgi:hypothetical protein
MSVGSGLVPEAPPKDALFSLPDFKKMKKRATTTIVKKVSE